MDIYTFLTVTFVALLITIGLILLYKAGAFLKIKKLKIGGNEIDFAGHAESNDNIDRLVNLINDKLDDKLANFDALLKTLETTKIEYESLKNLSKKLQSQLSNYEESIRELNLELSVFKEEGVEGISLIEQILFEIEATIRENIKESCLHNHFLEIRDFQSYIREKIQIQLNLVEEVFFNNRDELSKTINYNSKTLRDILNKEFIEEIYFPTKEVFMSFRDIIKQVNESKEFINLQRQLRELTREIQQKYYNYLLTELNNKSPKETNQTFVQNLINQKKLDALINKCINLRNSFLDSQRYKILDKQLDAAIILLIYFRKYFEKKLKELLLLYLKSKMPEKKLETKKEERIEEK